MSRARRNVKPSYGGRSFDDHVNATRRDDGTYRLDEAERTRALELADIAVDVIAAKAAHDERRAWEKSEGDRLRKVFEQPALDPSMDADVRVLFGDSEPVRMGSMNVDRVRLRMDLRNQVHEAESHAWWQEVTYWRHALALLGPTQTIDDYLAGIDA